MTAGDLCTVQDVVNETMMPADKAEQYTDQMAWKITDISNYIKSSLVSGNSNLIGGNTAAINTPDYYAFHATKFGVCEWLEEHDIVKKSEKIIEQKEGKVTQRFSESEPDYPSYSQQYGMYKRLLMGTPTVGAQIHTPHPDNDIYGPGVWWPPGDM